MSFAAVAAAGIGAAGAIGGSMLSSNASSNAAAGQSGAAQAASAQMLQAGRDANEIIRRAYEENNPQILKNYGISRSDLAQYAGLGGGAANQLATLLGIQNTYDKPALTLPEKPKLQYGGYYMGIKIPPNADVEEFKKIVDAENENFAAKNRGEQIFDEEVYKEDKKRIDKMWADRAVQATQLKIKRYQDEVKKAQAKYKTDLQAWNKQQQKPKPGNYGELMRTFSAADYMRDPTTGGKAPTDLTRPFSLSDYKNSLVTGGKAPIDLTRNFSLQDFRTDPGYAFRQQQGNLGIERSGAARGMQLSGATMKALQRFGQNLASDEYQRAYSRFNENRQNAANVYNDVYNKYLAERQNAANVYGDVFNRYTGQNLNRFNMLNSMLGQGQNAASSQANINQAMSNQLTGASQQAAAQQGQNLLAGAGASAGYRTDAAAAQAAGQIGSANAWNQGIGGVANAAMDYAALRASSNRPPASMNIRSNYGGW